MNAPQLPVGGPAVTAVELPCAFTAVTMQRKHFLNRKLTESQIISAQKFGIKSNFLLLHCIVIVEQKEFYILVPVLLT